MTAPEQLKAWHEDFEKALPIGERHRLPSQGYASFRIEFEWRGYLRAKQETEQIMKLAKFGAMVLSTSMSAVAGIGIDTGVLVTKDPSSDAHLFDIEYAPNIKATIKELLK